MTVAGISRARAVWLRAASVFLAVTVSAGCVADPVPTPGCFSDGAPYLDGTPANARRPDPLIPFSVVSDVCCDPSEPSEAARGCRELFVQYGTLMDLAPLASCAPEGYCYLDCRAGSNCACVSDADCPAEMGCELVTRAQAEGACEAQGQTGTTALCAVCQ